MKDREVPRRNARCSAEVWIKTMRNKLTSSVSSGLFNYLVPPAYLDCNDAFEATELNYHDIPCVDRDFSESLGS